MFDISLGKEESGRSYLAHMGNIGILGIAGTDNSAMVARIIDQFVGQDCSYDILDDCNDSFDAGQFSDYSRSYQCLRLFNNPTPYSEYMHDFHVTTVSYYDVVHVINDFDMQCKRICEQKYDDLMSALERCVITQREHFVIRCDPVVDGSLMNWLWDNSDILISTGVTSKIARNIFKD